MPHLEIRLLGPPDVRADGGPIAIPRRRTRGLLFYLAATGRPHARARLATLLWGESSDRDAARQFSDALYRLRLALPRPHLIATGRDQVWLESGAHCWIDVAAFETYVAAARQPDSPDESRRAALESAVGLWRGTLIEGFDLRDCPDYEQWLALERQRLEVLYLDVLGTLCECLARTGAHRAALRVAGRLLQADPLREDAHRWIMRMHAASGHRAAALRQYAQCRTILELELGVPPSPETEALRDRIAAGAFDGPATGAAPVPAGVPMPRVAPRILQTRADTLPLTGRDHPLDVLRAHLGAAWNASGRTILVTGEAGIGKSRLVAEIIGALPSGTQILSAQCQESGRALAFQPVIEAVRGAVTPATLAALGIPPPLWHYLCHLLPELSDAAQTRPVTMMLPGWERGQVFEALSVVAVALARRAPLVLALDDLHWADETTLLFLAYVGRRIAGERVMLIGTYRDDEAGASLRQVAHELSRQGLAATVRLDRLSADETVTLIERMAATRPGSADFGRWLHRESSGNPLFMAEMLRNLGERGLLQRDADGMVIPPAVAALTVTPLPLPDSLRDLIAGRLARLSEGARQALTVAAVMGHGFDDDLLVRTLGWPDEQGVAALDELLAAHVVVELPAGRYGFSHDKIREVAYSALSGARRALLHRRVGAALERSAAPAPGMLAYHFARGKDWLRAHRYALAAADGAAAAHANREAAAQYTVALDAAAVLEHEIGPAQLAAIYEARGRVWLGMSAYDAAMADFARSLDEARRAGETTRALSAQRYLALAHFWHHEPAVQALGYAHDALAEARRLDDRHEIAACSATLASILVTRGRLREGMAHAAEAIRVGRETGDDYLLADALGTLGMARGWRGLFAPARAGLLESLELARARQWSLLVPRGLFFAAINAAAAGDYEAALGCLDECRRYAEESDDRWWLARLPNTVGWIYQELNDAETAFHYNAQGVEAAQQFPWPEPLGNALVNLGVDWLWRQDLTEARRCFDSAAQLLGRDETMQWRWEARLWLGLGEWWLARGDAGQALTFAGRALALARQSQAAKPAVRARQLQGRALATVGHLTAARAALARAARLGDQLRSPRLGWETHRALAAVELSLGREIEAERHAQIASNHLHAVAEALTDAGRRMRFLAAASGETV